MRKLLTVVVAALFALSTGSVLAASHAGAKMDDKDKKTAKPTAEQCKKDPKMSGCEPMKK
jgi:Spy/CpxP family protein refolding chaperone